jgi:DNA-directed RNA polymerase delta subunit
MSDHRIDLRRSLLREYALQRWMLGDFVIVDEITEECRTLKEGIEALDKNAFDNGLTDPLDPWMVDNRDRLYREAITRAIRAFADAAWKE